MEANKHQRKAINAIIAELEFWRDCNDINSPTLYGSIDNEFGYNLEEEAYCNGQQVSSIQESLEKILSIIQKLE